MVTMMDGSGHSLRRGTAADAPALWAIRADAIRQTCRSHYPVEMLERWAASPLPETFPDNIELQYVVVGTAGPTIAGFATLNASTAEVEAVFVAPAHGGHGLGRQLLAHLEAVAAQQGLQSLRLCASLNAVAFYRAAGFRAVSEGNYTTSAGVEIACVHMEKTLA